jgi:hypothetical protein
VGALGRISGLSGEDDVDGFDKRSTSCGGVLQVPADHRAIAQHDQRACRFRWFSGTGARDQGESLLSILAPKDPSQPGLDPNALFNFVPFPGAPKGVTDWYVKPAVFSSLLANDLPKAQANILAATQRPIASNALTEQSGAPAWKKIPSWDVIGTEDHVLPPALQTSMAKRAGAHTNQGQCLAPLAHLTPERGGEGGAHGRPAHSLSLADLRPATIVAGRKQRLVRTSRRCTPSQWVNSGGSDE